MLDEIELDVPDTQDLAEEATLVCGRRPTAEAKSRPTARLNSEYQPGDRVGRYRIKAVIAQGGMGTVYHAEQVEPVRRDVALKMVRADVANAEMIQQFLDERQVLAKLDDSDIARIYDADATPAGQPFFVMEYADGQPIDQFCDERRLSVQERVALVIRVGRAVESAHHRGVLHCDLKPSNILVSAVDGRVQVKVIDFGIARTQRTSADDAAAQTATSGTPNYMSPEQARNTPLDARTDLYSLGAVLYRLLTGSVPIEPLKEQVSSWPELREQLATYVPELLSERLLAGDAPHRETLAADRSLTVSQLSRAFRGDLDWIARRALANQRSDRYATVGDFADDLQRYLDDLPLMTAVPGRGYRLRKFCRRHRGSVIGAGGALAILLISATVLSVGWWKERSREQAELAITLSEVKSLLNDAESAWKRARKGGPHADADLSRAEASTNGARTILRDHESHADVARRYRELQANLAFDRKAFELGRELEQAREQACGTDLAGKRTGATLQDGLQAVDGAFRNFGIIPGVTPPADVADELRLCPAEPLRKIIESLDFVIKESPHGAGIYVRDIKGHFTVTTVLTQGAAFHKGSPTRGDRLMAVDGRPLAGLNKSQVARLLAGPPRSRVVIDIANESGKPATCELRRRGKNAYWARDVLRKIDPDLWRTQLRTALLQADGKQLQQLANTPDLECRRPFSLIQLAGGLHRFTESPDPLRIMRLARQIHPDNFWTNHYMGVALIQIAGPDAMNESLRYLTAAIAIRPRSGVAHRNLATRLYQMQLFDESVAECRLAGKLEPDRLLTQEMAAAVLERARHFRPALREVENMLRNRPGRADWSERAARLAIRLQDWRKVIDHSDATLKSAPNNWSALEAKAEALVRLGRKEEALKTVRERLADHPEQSALHRALGSVLLSSGDYKAAVESCSRAAALDPSDAAARYFCGLALLRSGARDRAIREFRIALKLRPDYAEARRQLESLERSPH